MIKGIRLRYILVFFISYIALFASSTDKIDKLQDVSVQFHWRYQFEFAGFIAAKEKGFYKNAGLNVDLKEYKTGINIVDDVVNKKSNYGVYNSSVLMDYLKGKPIKLIASYFKRAAIILITKPYIKSPKDLIGKNIMAGTKNDFILNFGIFLKKNSLNINELNLVKHTYNIKDFMSPKIDAMTAFVSDQPYKLNELGLKYNIIDPTDYGVYILQEEMFTSQDEINKHPKRVNAFVEATKKGWEYAFDHEEEIIDIIHKKYAKDISKLELRKEANGIEKLILPYTYCIGSINKNFLNRQSELFKQEYNITTNRALKDYIYSGGYTNIIHKFSNVQSNYLAHNKVINVCVRHDFFPIDGFSDGKYSGIMSNIYKIISKQTGIKFNFLHSTSHKNLLNNIKHNRCKIVSFIPTNFNLFPTITTTKKFMITNFTLISTLDKSFIQNITLLKGKKLITQCEYFKSSILKKYPYLNIEVQRNKSIMMKKLLNGEVYSAIMPDIQADYFIDKYGYGKLKVNGLLSRDINLGEGIGVQKKDKLLLEIIQKSLDNISAQKIDTIINNWRITRYKSVTNYKLIFSILIVVLLIFLIMLYYHRKLKKFNNKLSLKVYEKTKELRKLNESLEDTVAYKMQQLIEKDKLLTVQSKQAVMGEMISMIAHQWRQPLSTITLQISNLQLKRMMGEEVDNKEVFTTLQEISDSIIYLSQTIDDFQTYFKQNKESVNIEIKEVLQKAVNFALPRLKGTNININIKDTQDIFVKIYMNEFIQVVLNIINNAIDAFNGLDRDKCFIDLSVKENNDNVEIYIQDNASGISPENMSKLFEPYFSTKGKNGTGLGLYMSQMIIQKQFGGVIRVKSSKDGTTFIIEINKVV